jgi:hypothetical protein
MEPGGIGRERKVGRCGRNGCKMLNEVEEYMEDMEII